MLAHQLKRLVAEANETGPLVRFEHANKKQHHGLPPVEDLAATLRAHLLRAGVDRADLHRKMPGTKRVTFYDLRATGITWEALAKTCPTGGSGPQATGSQREIQRPNGN
jgi:hypothetical protein